MPPMLTPEQRQRLEALAQDAAQPAPARRARALLLYDDGLPTREAAGGSGLSRGRARYWRRQFQLKGLAIFPAEQPQETAQPLPPAPPKARSKVKPEFPYLMDFAELARTQPGPGLLPDDSLAEAGRKVWRYQLAHMLLHQAGTLAGEDAEELHDMRVATRRMRAAFEVFGAAFKPKPMLERLRGLRAAGRALGRVRDLDVFMENARRYQAGLPEAQRGELQPLLAAWMEERESARQQMSAYLQGPKYRDFTLAFHAFANTPRMSVLPLSVEQPIPYLVRDAVPALVYTRLAAVRAFDALLDSATLEQFHALRIEFKKLRYTVEYFREVLGEEAKLVIGEIKIMQDHLGELNDAQVAAQILREFLVRWDALQDAQPVAQRRKPDAILAYLASRYEERQRLMLSFDKAWERFNRAELRQALAKAVAVL
ncbi:MAG: CHAD domain-containing protein [Chloroflexi bacterium]|nr:CHAD domain-containing protein [Chloroflexota bacterium]